MEEHPIGGAEMARLYVNTPNYAVLTYETLDGKTALRKHDTYAPLEELRRTVGLFHAVGANWRPGVRTLVRQTELIYFPPRTPRNDKFRLATVIWENFVWSVVSVPIDARRFVERLARQWGLRLANGVPIVEMRPGPIVPLMVAYSQRKPLGDNARVFPLYGPSVFTLEFAKGSAFEFLALGSEEHLRAKAEEEKRMTEIEERWQSRMERN